MKRRFTARLRGFVQTNGCSLFLASIVGLLLIAPQFDAKTHHGVALFGIASTAVLIAGIMAVSNRRRYVVAALVMGLPDLGLKWLCALTSSPMIERVISFTALPFFLVIIAAMATYVFSMERITRDRLFGAVCVYVLLALAWASVYALLLYFQPNAFACTRSVCGPQALRMVDLIYFSFTTLTTLGYGDVVPASSYARILTSMEAVIGVMFAAIFVARLVSIYRHAESSEATSPSRK